MIESGIAKSIDQLKWEFSIDQVYMFYEKLKHKELDNRKHEAICLANALVYASPTYDRSSAHKKQRMWERYVKSLDWDTVTKANKPTVGSLLKMFGGKGVKVKKK